MERRFVPEFPRTQRLEEGYASVSTPADTLGSHCCNYRSLPASSASCGSSGDRSGFHLLSETMGSWMASPRCRSLHHHRWLEPLTANLD
eukprot:12422164-Karenia_brevis.AAC.1